MVNNYLGYLKWEEFEKTYPVFPPSRPIEQQLNHILSSEVYRVLKKLPKGGDMHVHEGEIKSIS